MIKRISILFFCLSLVPAASEAVNWKIGAKGGISGASTLGRDSQRNSKYLRGIAAGGQVTAMVNDWFGLQLEGNYAIKGFRGAGTSPATETRLDYLEIPLLMRFRYNTGRLDAPYVLFGGYYGSLMSATFSTSMDDPVLGLVETETDIADFVKAADMGIITALGMEFPLGAASIFLEIRWTGGMVTVVEPPVVPAGVTAPPTPMVRTSNGSFLIGLAF